MRSFCSATAAVILGTLSLWHASTALAVTNQTLTLPAGTKIRAILAQGVDSRTLEVGTNFVLRIDEPKQPALDGAEIVGHVTDVAQPSGLDRAEIGFVFDYIKFNDGKREPIRAEVVNASVTNFDSARKEAAKFSIPVPNGQVTPGPILFQITFSPGAAPSITPPPSGLSGGYLYAASSHENITVPAGTPTTIRLTSSLTVP